MRLLIAVLLMAGAGCSGVSRKEYLVREIQNDDRLIGILERLKRLEERPQVSAPLCPAPVLPYQVIPPPGIIQAPIIFSTQPVLSDPASIHWTEVRGTLP